MKELYRFRQFLAEGVIKEEQYSGAIIRKGSSDKAKEDTKIVRQALKKAGIKFTNRGEFGMNFKDADLAQIKKVIAGEKVGEFVVSRDVNEGVIKEEQMGSYGKFLKVVKSYEDEEILSDFLDSYPKGQDISKSEYERFTEKHLGLSDPEDYRGENWKYIMSESVIKENMSLEVDEDFIELSADSGEYDGDLNDDGTVDFSVVYDDGTEFDESTWKSILGKKHAFVQISKKIPTKVEAVGDYVMITVDLEDLKKLLK